MVQNAGLVENSSTDCIPRTSEETSSGNTDCKAQGPTGMPITYRHRNRSKKKYTHHPEIQSYKNKINIRILEELIRSKSYKKRLFVEAMNWL